MNELEQHQEQFRILSKLETLAVQDSPTLKRDLSSDIIEAITENECEQQFVENELIGTVKWLVGSLVACNLALVTALIFLINPSLSGDSESNIELLGATNGYKTIAIEVPSKQASTLRMPNAHVDVLMDIRDANSRKKLAIAHFLPVLGVKNVKKNKQGTSTVYVLADEITAKRISLAKEESDIFVSPLKLELPAVSNTKPQLVALRDPYGRLISNEIAISMPTALYLPDHQSGKEVRHVLRNGYWTADESFDSLSF